MEALAVAMADQGGLIAERGSARESLRLVEQAHDLTAAYGPEAVCRHLEPLLTYARDRAASKT